jgi:hypothetical protein
MTNSPFLPVNNPGVGPSSLRGLGLAHPVIAIEIITSITGSTRKNITLFTFNLSD